MKTVSRRLEDAERNQTENSRAMTQAATQINIAAREQAQAFEQMSTDVTALTERLVRVERHAANDGMREAVKALHQGLSRVADQIASTASQSAEQIAALAGNMDSLATQVVEAHERTEATAQTVETHFASLDERLRVVERTAFSSAAAIDHTMENVEQLKANSDIIGSELRRHAAAVAQMKDVFDHLNARIAAAEQHGDTIEHLQESISTVEASIATVEASVSAVGTSLANVEASVANVEASVSAVEVVRSFRQGVCRQHRRGNCRSASAGSGGASRSPSSGHRARALRHHEPPGVQRAQQRGSDRLGRADFARAFDRL